MYLFAAMRIQLSEDTYDYLHKCEPKFIIVNRGLRLVLVSRPNLQYGGQDGK